MTLTVDDLARLAGRGADELTRRDVARGLLDHPPDEAAASLPQLRRGLVAAGNPLTEPFWSSAEATLERVRAGEATVGDVRRFVEATGTEPLAIIGMHVWEDADERGDLESLVYERLVAHLEARVAAGDIDPDALAVGDEAAWQRLAALQHEWMDTPLPDGTVPMDALLALAEEEWDAGWAAADAEALAVLEAVLDEVGERPLPEDALAAAAELLRAELASGVAPYDLLLTAAGLRPDALPGDDAELWLALAAGTIEPVDEPPDRIAVEELTAWWTLEHADWMGAIGTLARGGPGTSVRPDDLVAVIDASPDVEGGLEPDELDILAEGLTLVVELWQALGAVDVDGTLTPLGWWGLPEALRRVWASRSAV